MTIETVIQSYQQALNEGNTQAVMALYSNDPVFMPQHVPAQLGRHQVEAAYNHVFQTIKLSVVFTVHEVEKIGDVAYVRTTSAGITTILENDTKVTEGNNELFIFKQEDGTWKIHRYLFATNQPPR